MYTENGESFDDSESSGKSGQNCTISKQELLNIFSKAPHSK